MMSVNFLYSRTAQKSTWSKTHHHVKSDLHIEALARVGAKASSKVDGIRTRLQLFIRLNTWCECECVAHVYVIIYNFLHPSNDSRSTKSGWRQTEWAGGYGSIPTVYTTMSN